MAGRLPALCFARSASEGMGTGQVSAEVATFLDGLTTDACRGRIAAEGEVVLDYHGLAGAPPPCAGGPAS